MKPNSKDKHSSLLQRYFLGALISWTTIILASLGWNIYQTFEQTNDLAHKEVLAHFNKDQGFRLWGTKHGGIYVPVSEKTPPSPYLSHVPERDITTPSGKPLTLMNPAYMVRQLMEDYNELYGVRGKITGLVVLRPENSPDEWEKSALLRLKDGAKEVREMADINEAPYLRMMRPMYMKEGCDKCHGHLGFKTGDFRGGVTVAIPMAPYLATQNFSQLSLAATHSFIWLLGFGLIGIGRRQINSRIQDNLKAEAEILTLNQELEHRVEERTERLRAIVDTAADGIITIDETGTIESFNTAAEIMFGYSTEEVIGRPITLLMQKNEAELHDVQLKNYLETGEIHVIGTGREVSAVRKNGEVFPLYIAVSSVKLNNRELFTGIVRDMTEPRKFEQALLLAKEQAEKANSAKSQFLSSMSHEFRTPLNGILGFAQLLSNLPSEPLSKLQTEYVELILGAGSHLHDLVNDLLDLAKIESGNLALSVETIDPMMAVGECLDLTAPLAEGNQITVINNLQEIHDSKNIHIRADYVRFKQILFNLVSNAVKYNHTGGSVTLDCSDDAIASGIYRISVRDTGFGIPETQLDELFEPFNRLGQEAGEIEGSGVGLSVTKMLVELMNGRIGVESSLNAGSTFWIELPLATEQQIQDATDQQHFELRKLPKFKFPSGQHTILYVEDNPNNLRLISELLANFENITLVSAKTGEEGLQIARDIKPHVIILDINLPGMNGFETLGFLQSFDSTRDIPVIALSASAMPENINKGIQAGFSDYITKPFIVEVMLKAIEDALIDKSESLAS